MHLIYLNNLIGVDNDSYDQINPTFNHSQFEYHLRIWCNGTQRQIHTNTNDGKDSEDEN